MNKRESTKAQSSLSVTGRNNKNIIYKLLGLIIFLIGAFFITVSFFKFPITGHIISEQFGQGVSFSGLILEIIGVALMIIRPNQYNK